jgi:hypothetical protein
MIRIVLGFAVVIATASATTAQNSKASSANELAALSGRPASDYTAAFRAKLTQTFAAYCQELLNALPTNTPAEDAWVESEQKTTDFTRISRVVSSKEYSRHILKETFSNCRDISSSLIQAQNTSEQDKRTDTYARFEAINLVRLALNFNDDLKSYLSKIDLNRDRRVELEILLPIFRRELLTATTKALQDVPN